MKPWRALLVVLLHKCISVVLSQVSLSPSSNEGTEFSINQDENYNKTTEFPDISLRIVNGVRSENLPFFVTVLTIKGQQVKYCGGSLITHDVVITAAHCVAYDHPSELQILYGGAEWDKRHTTTARGVVVHKDFYTTVDNKGKHLHNDIALVFLKKSLKNVPGVRPVGNIWSPDTGEIVWLAGFGSTVQRPAYKPVGVIKTPKFLMKADVKVISNKQCEIMTRDPIAESLVCAHGVNKNSCQGDSGGPLYTNYLDYYALGGLLSETYGCADNSSPSLYTRIYFYDNWIKYKIKFRKQYYGKINKWD